MTSAGYAYAQGAQAGHAAGKGRDGDYVLGEEIDLAYAAALNQPHLSGPLLMPWSQGYEHGYRRAADGLQLESEYFR